MLGRSPACLRRRVLVDSSIHLLIAGQPMASGGDWNAISDLLSAPVPLLRSCLLPEAVLADNGAQHWLCDDVMVQAGSIGVVLTLQCRQGRVVHARSPVEHDAPGREASHTRCAIAGPLMQPLPRDEAAQKAVDEGLKPLSQLILEARLRGAVLVL